MPSQWKIPGVRPAGVHPEYLLVCGSRSFTDYELLEWKLEQVTFKWEDVKVVHGACRQGADLLAEKWAEANWYDRQHFPADWHGRGRGAGMRRNTTMVEAVLAEGGYMVAFWDGSSPGTADTIEKFRRQSSRFSIQLF